MRTKFWSVLAAGLAAAAAPLAIAAVADPPFFAPALSVDFPDPFVMRAGDRWLAYATNPERGRVNVQMATSPDLSTWASLKDSDGKLHDAMPVLPSWAKRGYTWAPEVLKTGATYVLYFTARDRKSNLQCIGAASAADPAGPFASPAADPLVCQKDLGGSIDPSPFRDSDGSLYLYFKNDGNNPDVRKPDRIFVQRLAPDGLSLTGEAAALLRNDPGSWEGAVIEAPTMVRRPEGYFLFFSGNDYGWPAEQRLSAYAMGYATCSGPAGPCREAPDNPLLTSRMGKEGCLSGPGHQAVFESDGTSYIAFHAWAADPGCHLLDPKRYLYVAPLVWQNGHPGICRTLRRDR
jgi:beta-xylosidase